MKDRIQKIVAREILSGLGSPTVEVRLTTSGGIRVEASVPSGTSTGRYEAVEMYDGGRRYRGRGVLKAVGNVNEEIAPALQGMDVLDQQRIDRALVELDGTPNKSRLGGNAVLAVSVAAAKAGAAAAGLPCYRYLGGMEGSRLPMPLATVLAGGSHSPSALDFEDYLFVCRDFPSFSDAVEALVESRVVLEEKLTGRFGPLSEVGGALAPPMADTREAFDLMLAAIAGAGAEGRIILGLDVAGSELYLEKEGTYLVGEHRSPDELMAYFADLTKAYPLTLIEDPFHEDAFEHFAELTAMLPDTNVVGDDLFASNPERIMKGIESNACNALLLKINQIGTVSEACRAADLAAGRNMATIASLRSNDTNDDFIADLAVAVGARQIKLGSPVRGERVAKYNRLLAIESEMRT